MGILSMLFVLVLEAGKMAKCEDLCQLGQLARRLVWSISKAAALVGNPESAVLPYKGRTQ